MQVEEAHQSDGASFQDSYPSAAGGHRRHLSHLQKLTHESGSPGLV